MENKFIFNEKTIEKNSEIYARYIIDKCISYAFFEISKRDLDTKISSHCFNTFSKKLLNSVIYPDFITFDRDEFSKNQTDTYFYDNVYYGVNDWKDILEPV